MQYIYTGQRNFCQRKHFAMFGAGTILARSATSAPNMGVATRYEERSRILRVRRCLSDLYIPQLLL